MHAHFHFHDLPRRTAAMGLAAAVTAVLFLIMHSLIAIEAPVLESSERPSFNPFMPPREDPVVEREEKVNKPEDPDRAPEWETPSPRIEDGGEQLFIADNFTPGTGVGDIDPGAGTSTIVPIFRIAPDYPVSALRRGIEGYVDLIFDVAPSGRTENIRVLAADPEGVFERAAIKTLAKWKYKPPTDDGVPYGQKDMTTRISFRLED